MFWLFNNDLVYNFYQIFTDYQKDTINNTNNIIFELNKNNSDNIDIDLDSYKMINIRYEINIIDDIIKYTNLKNYQTITFKMKKNFIKSDIKNISELPIFNFNYTNIDNNSVPNLIDKNYDYSYKFDFQIYKINNILLLIKQINTSNNEFKYYWLSKDLNNFSKLVFE